MELATVLYPVLSIGGLGLVFGLGLGYASIKFKVFEDPKIPLVRDLLPGANCGGCGFAGCDAFAGAVVDGSAKPSGCPVGGGELAGKIADILGVEAGSVEKSIAFVKCSGSCDKASNKYEYYGVEDCNIAMQLAGGSKTCGYGCMGNGSCVKACKFDAIHIVDGLAVVDKEKCVACGACVDVCPKKLIDIIPYRCEVAVMCNSLDNGKVVKAGCSVGCIGCKICEKACGADAVHVENFLAKVDYEKCTMCYECTKKCPTKAISGKVEEVSDKATA